MTYWSNSCSRVLTEQEFVALIGRQVQAAAPRGANGARVTFSFAGRDVRYSLVYYGNVGPTAPPLPQPAMELARELRVGRYQTGDGACLLMEVVVGPTGETSVRYNSGEYGPIAADLIFAPASYQDDLQRYPRQAPQWLTDYIAGKSLDQLNSGTDFPFPAPETVPARPTDERAAILLALDHIRTAPVNHTGHNLYSLTTQRIQTGWRVFTQAPPVFTRGPVERNRLILLVADDGVVEVPSMALSPQVNEAQFVQRFLERSRTQSRPLVAAAPPSAPVAAVGPHISEESTIDVPGADQAREARNNLWHNVGRLYDEVIPPPADDSTQWPGVDRGYRMIARTNTRIIATDGLSAPSASGLGSSLGLGAEVFLESTDADLVADGSATRHWLFAVLAAAGARVSTGGAEFAAAIANSPEPTFVELSGLTAPREWQIGGTVGVLLWTRGWGAPGGFDTPLGRVGLISVTLLRASEAVTVSSRPSAAGEIARALGERQIGHCFDPMRDPIF